MADNESKPTGGAFDYQKDWRFTLDDNTEAFNYKKDWRFAERTGPDFTIYPPDHFTSRHGVDDTSTPDDFDLEGTQRPNEVSSYEHNYKKPQIISGDNLYTPNQHMTQDPNISIKSDDPNVRDVGGIAEQKETMPYMQYDIIDDNGNPKKILEKMFSGSSTLVNTPVDDYYEEKKETLTSGLESTEKARSVKANNNSKAEPPTSPLHPFTRMNPITARKANLLAYNRTHIPIADIEFRKGFRHIFITRPECYIMSSPNELSSQAANDEDFASLFSRMPYILKLLSPRYITQDFIDHDKSKSIGTIPPRPSNFNYLLSNRVMGMTEEAIEIGTMDGVTKTAHNFTISLGSTQTSGKEGALSLSFRDTKHFEVYEMIRMWMLYISKRHRGAFAPSYNGYQKTNGFNLSTYKKETGFQVNGISMSRYNMLHPYDRAIEYPCTIFDIITNESDTKILHYNAYIGAYPYTVTNPMPNDKSGPITSEALVTVGFKYSFKITNNNKSLVQFNYNAGMTDELGKPTKYAYDALSFLMKTESETTSRNKSLGDYIGAANMFTGTPYIVMAPSGIDPTTSSTNNGIETFEPYLKFAPIALSDVNMIANLGITNNAQFDNGDVAGVEIPVKEANSMPTINPTVVTAEDKKQASGQTVGEIFDEVTDTFKENQDKITDALYGYAEANGFSETGMLIQALYVF